MGRPASRLRLVALLSVAAWLVHELRYALAFGERSSDALRATGHGYLELVCPLIGLLLLAAAGQLLDALARRRRDAAPDGRAALSFGRSWLLLSATLLGVFAIQESLEGVLSAGHASGVAALVGSGGWLAAPLSALAGFVVAFVLREADAAVEEPPIVLRGVLVWVQAAAPALTAPAARPRARTRVRPRAGRGPPLPAT